jgi:hypothetical protein
MNRLALLRREYNDLWNDIKVINDKFHKLSHAGEKEYLMLKKNQILNKLNDLEHGIREAEQYIN